MARPTLWIAGDSGSALSSDVECLKWQAYLAFRRVEVAVRTDIDAQGALHCRLPNLHVDHDTLLPAHRIPQWADQHAPPEPDYADTAARDESHAWTALLQGPVHAALLVATPAPSASAVPLLTPPPPPLTAIASLLPPFGARISYDTVYARYCDAIAALSHRLATDTWFLASPDPTPLDALVFAYLHSIVVSKNSTLRIQVARRANLVAWEQRVREQVCAAFK